MSPQATIKLWVITLLLSFYTNRASSQLKIVHLLTENLPNPESIDNKTPRFTWQLQSAEKGSLQTAYEIKVFDGKNQIWNSGKVNADQSVNINYAGPALKSATQYRWTVNVWDNKGKHANNNAFFRMGLLTPADWKAKWITPSFKEDSAMRPSTSFLKSYQPTKSIKSAIAYITCHGVYYATINDKKVGNDILTPGWTSYDSRLQYQVYDITGLLQKGQNDIQVTVGAGWYRGNLGWWGQQNIYGKLPALLFQAEVTYSDGSKEYITSDTSWRATESQIRYAEIYNGEIIDHNFNAPPASSVKVLDIPFDNLIATINEPISIHENFKPLKVFKAPNGETIVDFGQILVGFTRLKVKGAPGSIISVEHAETLDQEGNFYTANLRSARQRDIYILKGNQIDVFEPHFTFHGFRYARITGLRDFDPSTIQPDQVEALAIYSDMPQTGYLECSDSLINKLQHNIVWSQNGNFLDIPTDCPQRNERFGWTGDAQVFSRTATFNRQVNNFFAKWLQDLAVAQFPNGVVPFIIPDIFSSVDENSRNGAAGWSDAVTIIPWNIYLAYGDKKVLADMYPHMKAWVDCVTGQSVNGLWRKNFQFGDWLSYRSGYNEVDRSALTDVYLVAQAYYAYSTQLLINAARALNNTADVEKYTVTLKNIKDAFCREYVTPNGRILSNTQTSYVLALQFDLLPEELRPIAAKMLADNIISYDYHLTTGFLGVPFLPHVLSRFGYTDIAYKLLLQQTYPSWLYPVKMGATTIWERWDGIKPDGTFQLADMNSFNHYSYGAVGDWMYRVMAGIDTDTTGVGYKKIRIMPHPGGNLTYVKAGLQTYYGEIKVDWKIVNKQFILDVQIPANTTADIYIPKGDLKEYNKETVGSGNYHYEQMITN
jgi:alpha-L-rhamnosidase